MAAPLRPVFQRQGPASNCKITGKKLGWVSCTAYSMAMGIDVATGGARRPSGCKIRTLTGDTVEGLKLSQVAAVSLEHFGVRVSVRTGPNAISPVAAARMIRAGRGFVLQGNTEALLGTAFKSTNGRANHAVWVNEVEGGTDDRPARALVFDPAADGRRKGISAGPAWWPWDIVLAFAAALRPNDPDGPRLGPGKLFAGFIPVPSGVPKAKPPAGPPPAPGSQLKMRFGGRKTKPFPDRTRANPPSGRRVNVRRDPTRLDARDIVDRLSAGTLFIAYQRIDDGAKPPGSDSRTWFGNEFGTEWVHASGLRRIGGDQ